MKKKLYLILTLTILLSLSCRSVDRVTIQEPEGTMVIYTSLYDIVIESIWMELQRQFPAYAIEFVYGGTGVIQQRIRLERASGRLGADILMVADPAYSLELKEHGILHPFISKEAENLAFDYDLGGYWYPVRVSNMVLAFNPERSNRNNLPNSFYGFANDANVRRMVSMRNPLVSGTTQATVSALRTRYGDEFFQALGNQVVMIDYGDAQTLTRLESGESRVAMILEESILRTRQINDSRLEIIYPADGTVLIPSTIMIVNDRWSANRNTQTAEAIVDWFLGMEGQGAIVDGWMHSVRLDFPRHPQGSLPITEILANSMPVNWENVFRQQHEIRRSFEINVAANR
jgi:iron(III) transport system substrate-binding protein